MAPPLEEVIYEFVPVGNSVRVSAIDPTTGTEVVVIGPVRATRTQLERVARRKLEYVLKQQQGAKVPASKKGSGYWA